MSTGICVDGSKCWKGNCPLDHSWDPANSLGSTPSATGGEPTTEAGRGAVALMPGGLTKEGMRRIVVDIEAEAHEQGCRDMDEALRLHAESPEHYPPATRASSPPPLAADLVENLYRALAHDTDDDTGDVWLHREDADRLADFLARLSDPDTRTGETP